MAYPWVDEVELEEGQVELYSIIGSVLPDGTDYWEEYRALALKCFYFRTGYTSSWNSQGMMVCNSDESNDTYCGVVDETGYREFEAIGEFSETNRLMVINSVSADYYSDAPANGLHIISIVSGEMTKISDMYPCFYPSWSPDGRWIITVCGDDQKLRRDLYIMSQDGSNPTLVMTAPEGFFYTHPKWSPIGDIIAVYLHPQEDYWTGKEVQFIELSGPPFQVKTAVQKTGWGALKKKFKEDGTD